nr:TonB-dependent receptor [Rhizomicrobium palustre]
MHKDVRFRSSLFVGASAFALLAVATAAGAQQTTETVTVTGSRIPRANLEAPTAVTTISSEVLQMSGTVNVSDMLRSVPSFGVSGITATNSNFATAGAGISTLELRNLGEKRTLVLVNGRRWVAGVAGTSAVDFNTVPTDLIDRVDVITGGASAMYGSDALAGVINVILKTDYEGMAADFQTGRTEYDDEVQYKAHVMFGGNFANNKGNLVLSATWSRNEGAWAKNRANLATDLLVSGGKSSYSDYGYFAIPSTGKAYTVSSGTGATGTVSAWSSSKYGFDRQPYRAIETPVDRLVLSTNGHYNVSQNFQLYMETTFANTKSAANIEPYPHASADLDGTENDLMGVSIDNPYMPQALRDAVVAAGDNYVTYRRRLAEFGPRHYDANRDLYRLVIGAKGTVFNDFNWDTYFDWGHTLDTQNGTGQVNIPNMREALNARVATAADITAGATVGGAPAKVGDIICSNYYTWTSKEGCAPINIFGKGAVSPAALKYVTAPASRTANIDQQVLGASIEGPVATLPAGDLHVVGGFEYRREFASDVPDALSQSGQNAGNKEPETRGSYNVIEFFGETEIPVLKNEFLAKELTVGGAVRWSQYGAQGSTTVTNAYTGRVQWKPVDDLLFRGQYAKAVRVANINELFAPGGEDFSSVDDRCYSEPLKPVGKQNPQVIANCAKDPVVKARTAANGSFDLTLAERQGTGGLSGAGNKNLTPERSDTWTVGAVFNHDFGSAGALEFSVDYFNIDIENVITTVGRQQAINQCYEAASYPNTFCTLFTRKATGPTNLQGAITAVNTGYFNQGYLKEGGFDFAINYNVDLNEFDWLKSALGGVDVGQINSRLNWTYTNNYSDQSFGTVTNDNGFIGAPKHKAQLGFIYENGPVTLQWETDFQSRVYVAPGELTSIRPYYLHNLSGSYQITEQVQLFGGINNLLNIRAPFVPNAYATTGTTTSADVYDAIGRRFFVGARLKM